MQKFIDDSMTTASQPLVTPAALKDSLALTPRAAATVKHARQTINQMLCSQDKRLLVIVGPCSIHDPQAAMEYAYLLKQAATRFADELQIVMRVYFEKPRTLMGWKGLISDPFLDGSFDINQGITLARKILLDIAHLELPAATEFLDTIIPQYLSDLIAWSAIGARTAESQVHRELASWLPMPVGFKNTTTGNIQAAIDAVNAARHPQHFLSLSQEGMGTIIRTQGNPSGHIILRGSNNQSNYAQQDIQDATDKLKQAELTPRLMIDCSHGNSGKDYQQQSRVVDAVIDQITQGSTGILGVMLESHLVAGRQALTQPLIYGQSITDACLSWVETVPLLERLALTAKHSTGCE